MGKNSVLDVVHSVLVSTTKTVVLEVLLIENDRLSVLALCGADV